MILTSRINISAQTFADPPGPENVLVVYNLDSEISENIMSHYVDVREIPSTNIIGIRLKNPSNYGVEIIQEGEEINGLVSKEAGWVYVKEVIADTLEYYLNNTYYNGQLLKDIVRYLVICKGLPLKVRYADSFEWNWQATYRNRVSIDATLCLINQNKNLLDLFETDALSFKNPYFVADEFFTLENRFISNYFTNEQGWKLNYLVSRLDGDTYEDVIALIDSSVKTPPENIGHWVIDGDPFHDFSAVHFRLKSLGYLTNPEIYNNDPEWITTNGNFDPVIGYTSSGIHSQNPMPPTYILDPLDFNLQPGAIFNSFESFNGVSYGVTRWDHGLVSDFIHIGGSGGCGNVYEPINWGIYREWQSFPAYAVGYNLVDAIYQGIPFIAWQNTVVGDPLTRIYDCPATVLTSNTTISSNNYDCDIIVPAGITLTISASSIVNFNRNAALKVSGSLIIETGAEINFNSYSRLVLEEIAEMVIEENSFLHFRNNSTFNTYKDFTLNESSPFNFYNSSNIVFNGTAVITGNLNLTLGAITFNSAAIIQGSISSYAFINFNSSSELSENTTLNLYNRGCTVNGSLVLDNLANLNLNHSSVLTVYGNMILRTYAILQLNENNRLKNYGEIISDNASHLNIYGSSNLLSEGRIYLKAGATINQNSQIYPQIKGVFISAGNQNDYVNINFPQGSMGSLILNSADTVLITYTKIDWGSINLDIADGIQKPRLLSISNSLLNNSPLINVFSATNTESVNIILSDNSISINNNFGKGMTFSGFNSVQLIRNTVENKGSVSDVGVGILNNKSLEIIDCDIIGFKYGIKQGRIGLEEIDITNIEDIRIYNSDIIGIGYDQVGIGISIGYSQSNTTGVKIDQNNISGFSSGIVVNNDDDFALHIKNNTITNYCSFGISVSNGSEAVIKENIISVNEQEADNCIGINVCQVNSPSILGNIIDASNVSNPGPGMVLISSHGEIRRNTIQNHLYGIELGSASPKIGANTIINNKAYGIYISDNSNPDLTGTFVGDDQFPLSGYNTIRENGLCEETQNSELYLLSSLVRLEKGCNTIADDRDGFQQQCNNLYLVDGRKIPELIIKARANYWGNHPVYGNDPTGRFGEEVTIDYSDYFSEPCTYSQGSAELLLANSKGEVYDTVYSTGNTATGLSDIESRYAAANNYFYNNQYNQAKQEYEGIIQNYGNDKGSIQAYNRIYTIAKLINSSPSVFNQLKDFYLQQAANQTDSLMIGTLTHLSDLCLVSAEEYLPAINNFDEIAQQNPNTDVALYRQIDALTTSLLMPQDSSLNKGVLGKYSVNSLSEYNNKLSELLKTRGKSGIESEKELLPTQYTLYQNYPNPFNPTTTIKYDLPFASDVSLVVYDILGRKVKELANAKQQAGRYEIKFNSSNLASGVYVYQLIAEKYMSSKKMILLK